jgi:hypothetical protein
MYFVTNHENWCFWKEKRLQYCWWAVKSTKNNPIITHMLKHMFKHAQQAEHMYNHMYKTDAKPKHMFKHMQSHV